MIRASLSVAITASPMLPRVAVHRSSLCNSLVPNRSTWYRVNSARKTANPKPRPMQLVTIKVHRRCAASNALDAQSCFHTLKLRDLLSKGIHSAFPLLVLVDSGVSFSRLAKGDHFVGVPHPRLHSRHGCSPVAASAENCHPPTDTRPGIRNRISSCPPDRAEGALVAGYHVSAHAGFHIHQQLEQTRGLVENLIGMVNPLQGLCSSRRIPTEADAASAAVTTMGTTITRRSNDLNFEYSIVTDHSWDLRNFDAPINRLI